MASVKCWNIEDFHCILANGDSGFVHDILPRMDKASLKKCFMEYSLFERQKVKYVCCDMHGPYIRLAKECFPNATICVDLFHVVRRVADCVNEVRIRLQHKFQNEKNDDAYTLLRNSSKLLTTAKRNQARYWSGRFEKTKARLDCALSVSDDLKAACDALQEFHQMTEEPKFELRRLCISDRLSTYTSCEVPEVRSAANCVKHYRSYIQNSLKYNKSNSTAEGRNRVIKEIKRNSYGQHSFENFRKRILLAFGPTQFINETYTVFGEKRCSFLQLMSLMDFNF